MHACSSRRAQGAAAPFRSLSNPLFVRKLVRTICSTWLILYFFWDSIETHQLTCRTWSVDLGTLVGKNINKMLELQLEMKFPMTIRWIGLVCSDYILNRPGMFGFSAVANGPRRTLLRAVNTFWLGYREHLIRPYQSENKTIRSVHLDSELRPVICPEIVQCCLLVHDWALLAC